MSGKLLRRKVVLLLILQTDKGMVCIRIASIYLRNVRTSTILCLCGVGLGLGTVLFYKFYQKYLRKSSFLKADHVTPQYYDDLCCDQGTSPQLSETKNDKSCNHSSGKTTTNLYDRINTTKNPYIKAPYSQSDSLLSESVSITYHNASEVNSTLDKRENGLSDNEDDRFGNKQWEEEDAVFLSDQPLWYFDQSLSYDAQRQESETAGTSHSSIERRRQMSSKVSDIIARVHSKSLSLHRNDDLPCANDLTHTNHQHPKLPGVLLDHGRRNSALTRISKSLTNSPELSRSHRRRLTSVEMGERRSSLDSAASSIDAQHISSEETEARLGMIERSINSLSIELEGMQTVLFHCEGVLSRSLSPSESVTAGFAYLKEEVDRRKSIAEKELEDLDRTRQIEDSLRELRLDFNGNTDHLLLDPDFIKEHFPELYPDLSVIVDQLFPDHK